jgi:radical SAM protein with 4Fe4S-binding SPASM domain
MQERVPVRAHTAEDELSGPRPVLVVWELTMHCDQPCGHCGSRAGKPRPNELTTAELLEVVDALARLRAREVALIGGEAYLRSDLFDVVRALDQRGIRVSMQTGGRAFTQEMATELRAAGLSALGVSIDGPARVHDRLRGNLGSHAAAVKALKHARAAGLVISANTQVNRLTFDHLRETAAELQALRIQSWQVQLTGPMGRAADRPEWILEPWRVVELIDMLADIQLDAVRRGVVDDFGVPFDLAANNNIGFFGPHEQVIRSRPGSGDSHYSGCQAGVYVLGIESDGTVKGCPTLPTASYAAGNVRTTPLEQLWESAELMQFARRPREDELWGFCKTCYYADVCKAGCSWTVHTTLGRRGNNPFCYHRVVQLRKKGIRERLVPVESAPNRPYDHGRFEIVEEPWPSA